MLSVDADVGAWWRPVAGPAPSQKQAGSQGPVRSRSTGKAGQGTGVGICPNTSCVN